ncbi:extracellular solute-binding protein [uncultured Amphritea sp.]|uniref:extracellular solute-binding protein n=1 Tax=Amphritea sp. TaxID=1872502 RepID=UPI001DA8053C|nr:extracellular solute-binding protein [uncultured Amphritea sp.]MBR9869017.1 extracellular solute-binding protein [Oceanospirillales bacterium]MBR9889699.1 extracellular solute-binding protein [Oceanospirillales bacterium]
MNPKKLGLAAALAVSVSTTAIANDSIKFYNWSDYIAPDTLTNFEKATGLSVTYDVFDSNEVLEAKLMAGGSGFDLVVPGSQFLGRQIMADVFLELDREKLPHYKNLDAELMKVLAEVDPDNRYGIPYLWGTTGIGYNVDQVKKALGEDAPVNSWDLVFKPENLEKLASCGVALLDAPAEILPIALNYLGKNPNSTEKGDYSRDSDLGKLLSSIRPSITYFHSSKYINDLANGDICVAVGWSGDILQGATRAEEAGNGVKVAYSIPKEGTAVWFDMLAIPSDAKHPELAHKLLDYLLEADVIAGVSNYVAYANGNKASTQLIDAEITSDPTIYPSDDVKAKLFSLKVMPKKIDRFSTRLWTDFKANR